MKFSGPLFLSISVIGTVSVIALVHYMQKRDRDEMHKGVLNDIARLARKEAIRKESN